MSSILNIVAMLKGDRATEAANTQRRKVRRASTCEALEGRQLLNGSWSGGMGRGGMDAAPEWGSNGSPAQFQSFRGQQNDFSGIPSSGRMGFHASHGQPFDDSSSEDSSTSTTDPSASASTTDAATAEANREAFETLQSDIKTLQGMVSTTLQDAIKADVQIIDRALASIAPKDSTDRSTSSDSSTDSSSTDTSDTTTATDTTTTSTDALTKLTTLLKDAKVSDNVISAITTDIQSYQSAIKSADSTLYDKITAQRATLKASLPTEMQTKLDEVGDGLDGVGGTFGIQLDGDSAAPADSHLPSLPQGRPGSAMNNQGAPSFAMNNQGGPGFSMNNQGAPSFAMNNQGGNAVSDVATNSSSRGQSNSDSPGFSARGNQGGGSFGSVRESFNNGGGSDRFGGFYGSGGFGGRGR